MKGSISVDPVSNPQPLIISMEEVRPLAIQVAYNALSSCDIRSKR